MANVLGGDVSKYQDDNATLARPDFRKAKAAGWRFVYLRYSGAYQVAKKCFTDEDLDYNYKACQDAGLPAGGYHYHAFSVSGSDQAKYFGELLEKYSPNPLLGIWGDYECGVGIPAKPADSFAEFMAGLSKWKRTVYTRATYWNRYGTQSTAWLAYGLAVAHYGVIKPSIPLPWTEADFWQFTSSGNALLYGMEYDSVDLDWCLKPEKYGLDGQPVSMEQRLADLERRVSVLEAAI